LEDITFPWAIADTVWQHHERLDGPATHAALGMRFAGSPGDAGRRGGSDGFRPALSPFIEHGCRPRKSRGRGVTLTRG
jgi:hypothetical protein